MIIVSTEPGYTWAVSIWMVMTRQIWHKAWSKHNDWQPNHAVAKTNDCVDLRNRFVTASLISRETRREPRLKAPALIINQVWNLKKCLYLPPFFLRVSVFYEEVASQTGIGVQLQHLLYLGHDLPLEGNMKVVNLPSTSPTRPLILLSYGIEANTSLPFRERKNISKDTNINYHLL